MDTINLLYVFKFEGDKFNSAVQRLKFSVESLIKQDVNIIIFNASTKCFYDGNFSSFDLKYYHNPINGFFNKPLLINYAALNYIRTDYFIFSDIDLVYKPDYIEKITKFCDSGKKPNRVVFWNYNVYENKQTSNWQTLDSCHKSDGGFAHGNGLIHLKSFMNIHGYDETYRGYGPEDDDFNKRIQVADNVIYNKDIVSYHLYHEPMNREFFSSNMHYYNERMQLINTHPNKDELARWNGENPFGLHPEHKRWMDDKGDSIKRFEYNLNSDSIVFDIGSYLGNWSKEIYEKYKCKIYNFEPVKKFYKSHFRVKDEKYRIYNFGLSGKTIESEINLEEDASSLYGDSGKGEIIKLVNIADFINNNKINNIDLMKINVEGEEYNILSRLLDDGLIKKIRYLQIQFHTINPLSLEIKRNIMEKLKTTHSQMWKYGEFIWESWERK